MADLWERAGVARPGASRTGRQTRPGTAPQRVRPLPASSRTLSAPSIPTRSTTLQFGTAPAKGPGASQLGGGGGRLGDGMAPRSTLQQVRDAAFGIPAGMAGLIVETGKTVAGGARLGIDAVRGDQNLRDAMDGGLGGMIAEYAPLVSIMQQSGGRTLGRAGAAAGALTRLENPIAAAYGEDSREGNIVEALLEDIGNTAIVGGVAARAIGSGSRSVSMPVRVAQALQAGNAKSVGASAATLTAPTRRQIRDAGRVANQQNVGPAPHTPQGYGRLVPLEVEVQMRGTGLAGALERAGADPSTVRRVSRLGENVRTATRLGESVDRAQFAWPLRGAAFAARPVTRPIGRALQPHLARAASGQGPFARVARPFTPDARAASRVHTDLQYAQVQRQRMTLEAEKRREALGLDKAAGRVALHNLDRRFDALVDAYDGSMIYQRDPVAFERFIEDTFRNDPPQVRPTADDVRLMSEYRSGRMDPETRAAIDDVSASARAVADVRTQESLATEGLNPDQLGTDYLPGELDRQRSRIERQRDAAQRKWEPAADRAQRASRMAAAQAAVNRDVPPAPLAKVSVQSGRQAGKLMERARVMRAELTRRKAALDEAIREYLDNDTAAAEVMRELEKEIEHAHRQIVQIEADLRQANRQADAAAGLSRASGEVAETRAGGPDPEMRPTPEAAYTRAEVQRTADEVRQELVLELEGQIETAVGGAKPLIESAPNRAGRGEYGWVERYVQPGARGEKFAPQFRRLVSDGYFVTRKQMDADARDMSASDRGQRRGMEPDDFQTMFNEAMSTDWSVDQVMEWYIRTAEEIIEVRSKRYVSDKVIDGVATRLDMDPALAAQALGTAPAAQYRMAQVRRMDQALDDLHDRYVGADQAVRDSLDLTVDTMLNDPSFTASDLFDAMAEYFPDEAVRGGILERLDAVPIDDAVRWLRSGEVPQTFFSAVEAPLGLAQRLDAGARAQNIAAGERRLDQANVDAADVRSLAAEAERARAAADAEARRALPRAERVVERGEARMEPVQQAADAADATAREAGRRDPYHTRRKASRREGESLQDFNDRTVPHPDGGRASLSPAERAVLREGGLNNRERTLQVQAEGHKRVMDRHNERIANLEGELGRRWQDRIDAELNVPAVRGMRKIVREVAPQFGRLVEDASGARVSGLAGRIANQFGFSDQLVGRLRELEVSGDVSAASQARAFYETANRHGVNLDGPTLQRLNDSWMADFALERIDAVVRDSAESGTRLNAPLRVIDLLAEERWMPAESLNRVRKATERYEKRRASMLDRLYDDQLRAVPARFRAPIQNARRSVRALLDDAERMNRQSPRSGDSLIRLAEDATTTLVEMVEAGIDPVHLIGARNLLELGPGTGARGGATLRRRSTTAQQEMRYGLRAMDVDTYARNEAQQAVNRLVNSTETLVGEQFGRRADAVVRDVMERHREQTGRDLTPEQLRKALDDAGWVPMDARGAAAIGPQTVVIPRSVRAELVKFGGPGPGGLAALLQRGNRGFKTLVLPFSVKWQIGNFIGNIFMTMSYGGLSPVQMARTMQQVADTQGGWRQAFRNEGLARWAPEDMAKTGLTFGEHQMMWGHLTPDQAASRMQRVIAKSFSFNQFWDNMFRSTVYLADLKNGVPTEQAMRNSLRALGDYTSMTPFERRVVREVLPFYAWTRHQTLASMRMPLYSPTRAAWVYNMGNLFADDELNEELFQMVGARLPLGGDRFVNIGNINPYGNPFRLPLDPTGQEFTSGITPVLTGPTKLIAGLDLQRGRGITRPSETAERGVFGMELPTSPLSRLTRGDPIGGLAEAAYMTAGDVPFVRTARDALFRGQRFDTGQLRPRQFDRTERTTLDRSLSAANLPAPQIVPISELLEDAKRREAERRNR